MDIKTFLKQPYPIPNQNWKTLFVIGLALSGLMLLMEPFGLSNVKIKYHALFLAGYGALTFLILLINLKCVIRIFSEVNWTILKQFLWSCWIVFTLGLANYVYTFLLLDAFSFNLYAIAIFQVYTFFIAIIPITILILIRQNRLLKLSQTEAAQLTKSLPQPLASIQNRELNLNSDTGKSVLRLNADDLLFIESVGNYVHIHYLNNGKCKVSILRNSMSKMEQQVSPHPDIMKCHRAFMVNINAIESVSGNAQGYRLKLKDTEKDVYVSRTYSKALKTILG